MVTLKIPFSLYTGYAKVCNVFVRGLEQANKPFVLHPVSNHIPDYADKVLLKHMSNKDTKLGIFFGFANNLSQMGTPVKGLYSMYESTNIPSDWVSHCKRANLIIVPSSFCVDLFIPYNNNIFIVEPGIHTDIFCVDKNRKENDIFTIGSVGVMSPRKGVDVLVTAFSLAFRDIDDVQLKIKTRDTRWLPPIKDSRIQVIDDDISNESLADFYKSLDLFVLPTRGEGFGLPPIEAALCGTPALVTRWSGPTQYIDDISIFGIEYTDLVIVPNTKESGGLVGGGYWAEPNLDNVVDQMRHFYNNPQRVSYNLFRWKPVNAAMRLWNVIERFM